jgi:hypothetical protein
MEDAASDSVRQGYRRNETTAERLDRQTVEFLNELRVAGTGIQVLFAFLLIVPFNVGFKTASKFDRYVYFGTLLCVATAAVLLIAPSVHHRLLFHKKEKSYLLSFGTRVTIIASVFLCIGLTGILVLVSNYVFGTVTATIVGVVTAVGVSLLWFAVPLRRIHQDRPSRAR